MKKSLLLTLALAAASMASQSLKAQSLTLLPNPDYDYSWAECISADGRYVGGTTYGEYGGFIYDVQTKEIVYFEPTEAIDMAGIANTGVGAGYDISATLFHTDGTTTEVEGDNFFYGITPDGKVKVGGFYNDNYMTQAAYWDENNTQVNLPQPSTEWTGFTVNGTQARWISADSSVIAGYIMDDYSLWPATLWKRNADGHTYSAAPICRDYFTLEEGGNKPYSYFMPQGLSENGQWLALALVTNEETPVGAIGRYNIATEELQVFRCDDNAGDFANLESPYPSAIANDGTLVGYTSYGDGRKAFIWEGGSETPELFVKKFPDLTELATYDEGGFHSPCGISADGRYIVGSGIITDEDENYELYSYVIDRNGTPTGISETASTKTTATGADRHFSIDGKMMQRLTRGINITKKADGRTVKTLKR